MNVRGAYDTVDLYAAHWAIGVLSPEATATLQQEYNTRGGPLPSELAALVGMVTGNEVDAGFERARATAIHTGGVNELLAAARRLLECRRATDHSANIIAILEQLAETRPLLARAGARTGLTEAAFATLPEAKRGAATALVRVRIAGAYLADSEQTKAAFLRAEAASGLVEGLRYLVNADGLDDFGARVASELCAAGRGSRESGLCDPIFRLRSRVPARPLPSVGPRILPTSAHNVAAGRLHTVARDTLDHGFPDRREPHPAPPASSTR